MIKKTKKVFHVKTSALLLSFVALFCTPTMHSANTNEERELIKKALNEQDPTTGYTGLIYACSGNLNYVKKFIACGANINGVSSKKSGAITPLHYISTSSKSDAPEISAYLLKQGANLEAVNANGNTPLHTTTNNRITKLLLEQHANILAKNNAGQTPLAGASLYKLWALHEKGANLNAKYLPGSLQIRALIDSCTEPTAFHTLIKSTPDTQIANDFEIPYSKEKFLNDTQFVETNRAVLIRYLIHEHINLLTPDNEGNSPLHLLATCGEALPFTFKARFHQTKKQIEVPLEPLSIKNGFGFSPHDLASIYEENQISQTSLLLDHLTKKSDSIYPSLKGCVIFFGIGQKTNSSSLLLLNFLPQKAGIAIISKALLATGLSRQQKTKAIFPFSVLEDIHCKELSTNWLLLIPDPKKKIKNITPDTVSKDSIPTKQELEQGLWIDHLVSISQNDIKNYIPMKLIQSASVDPLNELTLTQELIETVENHRLFISKNYYLQSSTTEKPEWITIAHGHSSPATYTMYNKKPILLPGHIFASYPVDIQNFFNKLCEQTFQKLIVCSTCYCGGKNRIAFSQLPTPVIFCTSSNTVMGLSRTPDYSLVFEQLSHELKQQKPLFEHALKHFYVIPTYPTPTQPIGTLNNIPLLQYPGEKPTPLLSASITIKSSQKTPQIIEYTPHPLKTVPVIVFLGSAQINHTLRFIEKNSGFIPPLPPTKQTKTTPPIDLEHQPSSLQHIPLIKANPQSPALFSIARIEAPSCDIYTFTEALLYAWDQDENPTALRCEKLAVKDNLFSDKKNNVLKDFTLILINRKAGLLFPHKESKLDFQTRALVVSPKEGAWEFKLSKTNQPAKKIKEQKFSVKKNKYLTALSLIKLITNE